MTEADVQRLLASEKIRRVAPDPEMARAELDVAALRDLRNQSEYEALHLDVEEVREALEHVSAIVEAIADDE